MGIEPTLKAWEASVLPLNYTRKTVDEIVENDFARAAKRRARTFEV